MVRILRFSVMTLLLVACIPQQQGAPGTPEDGAIGDGDVMMQQEQMMDGDGMMEDGDMMDGEGMMEDDMEDAGSMMMEGDDRMMEGGGSMKGGNGTMKDDMEDEDSMMMENKDSSAMHSVSYTAYRDGVIGNGESSVLFFHAAWCPYCQSHDRELLSLYNEGGANLSTYKIDYDTADALKAQFGVVQQDTFILIDGEGNAVQTLSFPSSTALEALVAG